MLRPFLISVVCFISSGLTAQITLNATDFQSTNGEQYYSTSDVTVDFSSTGANYNWDFSNLNEVSQDTNVYSNVSQASILVQASYGLFAPSTYQASYFTANSDFALGNIPPTLLPVAIDEVHEFVKVSSTEITKVGYSVSIQGQGLPFKSDTIERLYKLPVQYGDVDSCRAYTAANMNPIFDAQLKQYLQHYSEVDGYGSVTTPYGTFNCLRIHHTIYETDSIYMSTTAGGGNWFQLPMPTKHVYEWWTNGEGIPILTIETNETFGMQVVTKTEYKDNISVGTEDIENTETLVLAPNPSTGKVALNYVVDQLAVYNTQGDLIESYTDVDQVDLGHLPKGVYLLKLENNSFIKSARLILQ